MQITISELQINISTETIFWLAMAILPFLLKTDLSNLGNIITLIYPNSTTPPSPAQ